MSLGHDYIYDRHLSFYLRLGIVERKVVYQKRKLFSRLYFILSKTLHNIICISELSFGREMKRYQIYSLSPHLYIISTATVWSVRTFSKASSSLGKNLSPGQSTIVHLHTRDSSSEISPVTDTSSHSHRVVCRQPDSTDVLPCSKPSIDKQLRLPCSSVVCCTNKLPLSRSDPPTYNRGCETPSSSTRKPYKQRSR